MTGDFLVDTDDPYLLEKHLQRLGGALLGGVQHEGHYVARCAGDVHWIQLALFQMGYEVGDAPDPAPWDLT